MQIVIAHRIMAPLLQVEAAVLAPERVTQAAQELRTVAKAELLERRSDGNALLRRAQFHLQDSLLPQGWRTMLGGLGWIEEVQWNLDAHEGSFRIEPVLPPRLRKRVVCAGVYRLEAIGEDSTLRVIEGTLAVRVPMVGATVEAQLQTLLDTHFEEEARALDAAVHATSRAA